MKNLLLGLAACTLSLSTFAQEPFVCGHDEMRQRLIASDPTFLQREAEYEAEIQQLIRDNAVMRDEHVVVTIPVVFHILHLGGRENISDEQVMDQLAILNRDFRKLNPDLSTAIQHYQNIAADTRIEFALPTRDPIGNCTNGINRIYSVETLRGRDQSKLEPWPRARYLNIWVTDIIDSGAAGYAYKPGSVDGFSQIRDGIMIRHEYFGSIGTSNVGSSRALTHEVGHYFNLDHPWGATNEPVVGPCGDDGVEDTPLTRGHNNCSNRHDYECSNTPINAVMDFSSVQTGSGSIDPTPLPEPVALYNITTPDPDTIGQAITFTPTTAFGISGNSMVAGEFAFSGWDDTAEGGETVDELTGAAINTDKFYEFSFTPTLPMAMSAQQLVLSVRRSEDGPRTFAVRRAPFGSNLTMTAAGDPAIQIVGGSTAYFATDTTGEFVTITVNLGPTADPEATIALRIYAWNAETPEGYFAIDNVSITGTTGVIENIENYMEYAYCQKMFTEGQSDRMRAALISPVGQRSSLWTDATLQAVGIAEGYQAVCAPTADFYAVPGTAQGFNNPQVPYPPYTCAGTSIQFRDNSGGGEATGWSWTFQDGEPATSSEENPVITFTSSGWKEVTLTVSNDVGADTKTSPFTVFIGAQDVAMAGLGTYGFEEPVGTWPFLFENYENNLTRWQRYVGAGQSGNACVFLNSGERDMMDFIDPDNGRDYDDLVSPLMDLSGMQEATLSFWFSYSTQTTDIALATERLQVQRSTDCGRTWQFILSSETQSTLTGSTLITNGNSTTPGSWQYRSYNIPANTLTDNVRFRWRFISSEFSNNLYIDEINIAGPVGINDATGNAAMSIHPNPTNDQFFVRMTGMDVHATEITLLDSRGAIVYNKTHTPQGGHGIMISSQDLGIADGLYVIRVSNNAGTSTQKLVVGR